MLKELEKINIRIEKEAEKEKRLYYFGRFFPSTEVMFVAERPTVPKPKSLWNPRDNFYVSRTDHLFIKILNQYGFNGSYITDIVKSCDKAGRSREKEINQYFPFLQEEINIIRPKLIVAVGRDALCILKNKLSVENWVVHPSALRYPKNIPRLKKQLYVIRNNLKT